MMHAEKLRKFLNDEYLRKKLYPHEIELLQAIAAQLDRLHDREWVIQTVKAKSAISDSEVEIFLADLYRVLEALEQP